MKGISPIVAVVLLVAITMTVAGILAFWGTSFIQKTLPTENITTAECRVAQFEFANCKYNSTSQKATFVIENKANIELKNLTAFVTYSDNTVSNAVPLNVSLGTGTNGLKSFIVSDIPANFTQLTIKTNCPELSRLISCERGS